MGFGGLRADIWSSSNFPAHVDTDAKKFRPNGGGLRRLHYVWLKERKKKPEHRGEEVPIRVIIDQTWNLCVHLSIG
jgi:hypothetical protein